MVLEVTARKIIDSDIARRKRPSRQSGVRNRQARQIRGAWYSSAVGYIFAQGKVACAFSQIMMDTGGDTGQSPLSGGPSMRTVHQQER